MDSQQLRWVVSNRRQRSRTEPLAIVAEGVVRRAKRRTAAVGEEISQAVAAVVDQDFAAHCALGPEVGGVLTIYVDDERLVYPYRVRWALDILEKIRMQCPRRRVRKISFVKDRHPDGKAAGSRWATKTNG